MMSWDALGTMAAALMAFIALNAGTLRWLFERHETATADQMATLKREGSDFSHEVERQMMRLKAQLPLFCLRAVRAVAAQLKWHYMHYEQGDAAVWGALGKVYRYAEEKKIHREAVPVYPGVPVNSSAEREFMKAADITGLVLTKLDGTAKGGIAVAIAKELNLPIRYCGIGEKADDLVVFDPRVYVEGLFE
jgi:hypothetical protein